MTFRPAALAAMLGLAPAVASAVFPDFGGLDPSTGAYRYMLYDTDGVAGARDMSLDFYSTGTNDRFWPDGTNFAHLDVIGSISGSTLPAEWIGDPYWIRLESPAFGCVVFSDVIGAMYQGPGNKRYRPVFLIPVSFGSLGIPQSLKDCMNGGEIEGFSLYVAVYMADTTELPTIGLTAQARTVALEVPATVTVNYLAGNILEAKGFDQQVGYLGPGTFDTRFSLDWGGTESWMLDSEIPIGPIEIIVDLPGFAAERFTMEVTGPRCMELRAVLTPLDAGSRSALPQGLEPNLPMNRAVQSSVVSGSAPPAYLAGCTLAGGGADRALDPNMDGVNDAADLMVGSPAVP